MSTPLSSVARLCGAVQTMRRRFSLAAATAGFAYAPLVIHTWEAFCSNVGSTTIVALRGDTPHPTLLNRRTASPACSAAAASCKLSSRVSSGRRRRRRSRFTLLADPAEASSDSDAYDDSLEQGDPQQQLPSPAAGAADAELVDKGGVSKDRLAFEELGTREVDRLFSTLEPCDVSGFRRKPANLLDAASLIGGTAVGAGILALPAATLQAGVLPSSVGLVMM